MIERFPIAPMSTDLRIVTWVVAAVPAALAVAAATSPLPILWGVFGFVALLYAFVGLWWRPTSFLVGDGALVIRWPVRARRVELAGAREAEVVDRAAFQARYGHGMRVGAGGLWGGFGLLVTRRETFSMYISRTDRFVLVRPATGRALLVTPSDPERFVAALERAAGRPPR